MEGYIKLYRKIEEWGWYKDIPTKCLFFHLLIKANIKDTNYRGTPIKKGSLVTGRFLLSKETGLTEQQIRTSLTKLKSTNEITIESTNSFSFITIQNWDSYQDALTNNVTNEQPTDNQRITTGGEGKKVRSKEVYIIDEVYRQGGHLSITNNEFNKLEKEFGAEKADDLVSQVLNYRKNINYKSLYLTAVRWGRRKDKTTVSDEEMKKRIAESDIY